MSEETETQESGLISATKKDSEKTVTVKYEFPATLATMTEKFGEDVIYDKAVGALTIDVQSVIRRNFDKSDEEIQEIVSAWVPGVRQVGVKKTPLEKAQAALRAMSAEDRAALLAQLSA